MINGVIHPFNSLRRLRKQPSSAARAMGGGASTPRAAGGLGSAAAKARGGKGRGADPYGYVGRRVWYVYKSDILLLLFCQSLMVYLCRCTEESPCIILH